MRLLGRVFRLHEQPRLLVARRVDDRVRDYGRVEQRRRGRVGIRKPYEIRNVRDDLRAHEVVDEKMGVRGVRRVPRYGEHVEPEQGPLVGYRGSAILPQWDGYSRCLARDATASDRG